MTPPEIVELLTLAATYDYRKIGEADVEAWHLALDDITIDDAKTAVVAHYRESTDRLMPAHVRQGVRALRALNRRHEPHEIRALPCGFDHDTVRQVQLARGVATVREVLAPVLEHLAERAAETPAARSAVETLREITPGPEWTDAAIAAPGEELQ
jgi:hypothetical protein